jgi:octaprenyl-diphosphate synthase
MIDAEAIQLEQRGRSDIDEDDYFQIVDGKTAVLFEWCAEAGARLAFAPEPMVLALAAFAYEVGVAFQLLDDVLDLSQEPGAVGKSVLQDVRSGTLTYPLVRAFAQRPDLARRLGELRDRAPDGEALGQLVLSVVAKTGGLEAAREEIMRRTRRAHAALSPLPESPSRNALLTLATELAARTG